MANTKLAPEVVADTSRGQYCTRSRRLLTRLTLYHSMDVWPWCCHYSEPLTIDSRQVAALLDTDTRYAATWHLVYTSVSGQEVTTATTHANDAHQDGIFSPTVGNSQLLVVFIRKQRRWGSRASSSVISLHEAFWRKFLATFNILPSFLLLEHSNNGGSFFHTTTESRDTDDSAEATSRSKSPDSPVAIHLGYKSGNWYGEEKAIYARQDLRTGRSFVLVMGMDMFDQGEDRIRSLLQANPKAHFLHVVHALQSYSYGTIEFARYQRDYTIQEFEAADGVVELGQLFSLDRAKGSRPKASPDNKRLRGTAVCIRNLASGSARGRIMCEQFLLHLDEYAAVTGDTEYALPDAQMKGLREATRLLIEFGRHQRDQIEELYSRAIALIDVRKVAMARRDTQINLDIATAAKHDSELMRGIAAVTMIFLPGTFVATFFSMVFFQNQDNKSGIDRRIWLYPAITLPLTVGVVAWYLAWSYGWTWKHMLPSSRLGTEERQAALLELRGDHNKQEHLPLAASDDADFFKWV